MTDAVDRLAVAERAARAGAEVAAEGFRSGIDVETKTGKTDVVTEADRAAQRRVIEVVTEEYPDDAIVGEEEDELKAVPDEGDAWIIDPIDGTNNYVRDVPVWTTSVAAVRDGDPVAAVNDCPALGDRFVAGPEGTRLNGESVSVSDRTDPEAFAVAPTIWWDFDHREEYAAVCREIVERFGDMRRFGCAQVTLGMVAAGSLEGTVTDVVPNPWDTVAGVYMVRQAGGVVTDLDGNPWRHDSEGLVASNGEAHDELLAAVRDVA
ncbi:inositol monophosphatase [Halorussus salilacus]|uniref:inositol monophosphatase family protein n=1 Tax=Halorussus salilacus TaxID=2953750 RepID=UPI00209DD669|nr:inositol monophosphatase [Halorussus salilacus]USZ67877.1 inositol monophosphatase [Halorussus salilacus]